RRLLRAERSEQSSVERMFAILRVKGGPKRVNHAAASVGSRVFSFGGYCSAESDNVNRPLQVHVFDIRTLQWSAVIYSEDSSVIDPLFQRYGHTVSAHNDSIYMFGGRNELGACNALYKFNTVSYVWSQPKVKGFIPSARDGHSSCVIDDCMFVFGGLDDNFEMLSQSLYCLNLRTLVWTLVKTYGVPPSPRDFHTASNVDGRMYVFGGRSNNQGTANFHEIYESTVYCLDTSKMTWNSPFVSGEIPTGRRSHSAFVSNGKMYIFGGYNGNIKQHFNDLHCFDTQTSTWHSIKIKGRKIPCPRRRQCLCLIDNRVYIFGGTSPRVDIPLMNLSPLAEERLLNDHSDLYVIDIFPSLRTLCLITVLENNLETRFLPQEIVNEIKTMISSETKRKKTNNTSSIYNTHFEVQ
ncbi:kelch domain-containing protein 3-like protein, partial [Dinothrombium tinctorium]